MGISRIRFIQDVNALWYWQYVDDQMVVIAEGRKLYDNLEACVTQAGVVTGTVITLSYETHDFGQMRTLFVNREKPLGIEVRMFDATSDAKLIS